MDRAALPLPSDITPATAVPRWPGQLAAIDMGSNSFRLEIGQLLEGRYRRIDYLKETVRLGAGLDGSGVLTEDAALRGLACLARFAQRLKGYAAPQVRAVATQTLREARNRDAFLARARAVLGFPIEVISGREEARLIYAGVARLQPSDERRLVIDIGGRSTEMILGHGRKPLRAESFQVGSVSLSLRYFGDGRFTEEAFREAQVAVGAELEEALVDRHRFLLARALVAVEQPRHRERHVQDVLDVVVFGVALRVPGVLAAIQPHHVVEGDRERGRFVAHVKRPEDPEDLELDVHGIGRIDAIRDVEIASPEVHARGSLGVCSALRGSTPVTAHLILSARSPQAHIVHPDGTFAD